MKKKTNWAYLLFNLKLFEEILDILEPEINEQVMTDNETETSSEKKSQKSRSATVRSRSTYIDRNV